MTLQKQKMQHINCWIQEKEKWLKQWEVGDLIYKNEFDPWTVKVVAEQLEFLDKMIYEV